jgi:PAS domain S-box-containing protein
MAGLRILVVDDDVTAASELEAMLATLGHHVVAICTSADEAAATAAATVPELVVIAIEPPGEQHGVAAAAAIRRERQVPVVFVGSEPAEADLQQAGVGEAYGYLVAPFSNQALRTTIELALCRDAALRSIHDLEGFFAVSLDMFCFLDFSGYFKRLNPAWEKTLGFTREELMSRPFIEFVHPDDRERTLMQNAQVRGGDQARGFENRYRCKDGSYRWFLWNASARSSEGVIYSVARDITARKQAEEERAQLVLTLEASLAEVRTLQDILPICMYCKQIRDDEDYWHTVESYISRHTKTLFSHAICPRCMLTEVEPEFTDAESD